MTYLNRLPLGSRALSEREVLEGIIERTRGEGPLADEARKALVELEKRESRDSIYDERREQS